MLDQVAIHRVFLRDEISELFRCAAARADTACTEFFDDIGGLQNPIHLAIERFDDCRWHSGGPEKPQPDAEVHSLGNAFIQRGDVREIRRSFRRGHGNTIQLSAFDQRHQRGQSANVEVDLSAHDVRNGRCCAFVGNLEQIDIGPLFEVFADDVSQRAGACRGPAQAIRCLALRNQVLRRLDRAAGGAADRCGCHGHCRDRRETLDRVVRQARVKPGSQHHVVGLTHHERIAIRRRLGCVLDREVTAGTWPVFNDHLPASEFGQFGADDARHEVRASARCEGHENPDRLLGIFLGVRAKRCAGQHQDRSGTRKACETAQPA